VGFGSETISPESALPEVLCGVNHRKNKGMSWRIGSSRLVLVPSSFLVLFLILLLFGKIIFAQLALLLFLISFWVFRVVERKEQAERIARSKAEYLDGDSKYTA
jgi:Flp pilus assembly protein TadB